MDLIYRFDPFQPLASSPVQDAEAALAALRDGNERFADIVARMQARMLGGAAGEPLVIPMCPVSLGLPIAPGMTPRQAPFGLVLGCSDARVPTEAIFDQSFNDLFVVRIAGNVLGTECVGSIDYAVRNLGDSLKVAVVLGHSGCGAVTAAVAGHEAPSDYVDIAFSHALRSLVDRIQIAVRGAAKALRQVAGKDVQHNPGYRKALVEVAVYLNAAVTAYDLAREIHGLGQTNLRVVYGVCDLGDLRVQALPDATVARSAGRAEFADAPAKAEDFVELAAQISQRVVASGALADPGLSSHGC
jgi:carbonic anhydrase